MLEEAYPTQDVRKLLNAALSSSEFSSMVFDHFPSVHTKFSAGMNHDAKITCLIDYCKRFGETVRLLDIMREINPYQYERVFPSKDESTAIVTTSIRVNEELEANIEISESGLVQINLVCQSSEITPEILYKTFEALASTIEISSNLINVKSVSIEPS